MLCSPDELGLPDKVEGLLICARTPWSASRLPNTWDGAGDVVYDLEITPNRPDWNSVIGIAREISALTGNPLRLPEITFRRRNWPARRRKICWPCALRSRNFVRVTPRASDARRQNRPQPGLAAFDLEKAGLRSINNVVDVTNYVMLETGQPLHAFDFHLLGRGRPAIVVRRAPRAKNLSRSTARNKRLTDQMLLIADETKAVALAGVMGGQNSEINSSTTDVLIESACFKPQNIRATSKKLELRTDSSYRFERGADPGICDWASRRAAQLILQTAGGLLLEPPIDAYPAPLRRRRKSPAPRQDQRIARRGDSAGRAEQFLERLGWNARIRRTPHFASPLSR
jgi:phenylalanyl-tRNA synthetase beta chain